MNVHSQLSIVFALSIKICYQSRLAILEKNENIEKNYKIMTNKSIYFLWNLNILVKILKFTMLFRSLFILHLFYLHIQSLKTSYDIKLSTFQCSRYNLSRI